MFFVIICFLYVPPPVNLQAEKTRVLKSLSNGNIDALECANDALKQDQEFMLSAVQKNGHALQHASEKLRADKKVILEAVRQNGYALQHANDALKQDREFVLKAVRLNGDALKYASDILRNDREIVLVALNENMDYDKYHQGDFLKECSSLRYASDSLKRDREFVLKTMGIGGSDALKHASDALKGDRKFVLEAMRRNGKALQYASDESLKDQEIVLEAVRQNGKALKYADNLLRGDRVFVLSAVEKNGDALQYASEKLQGDPEIKVTALCSQYKQATDNQEKLQLKHKIVRLVIETLDTRDNEKKPVNLIHYIDGDIRRDPPIIQAIIKNYSDKEILHVMLKTAIFGLSGDYDSDQTLVDKAFQQIDKGLFRLSLSDSEKEQWEKFKKTYGQPNPEVSRAGATPQNSGAQIPGL